MVLMREASILNPMKTGRLPSGSNGMKVGLVGEKMGLFGVLPLVALAFLIFMIPLKPEKAFYEHTLATMMRATLH